VREESEKQFANRGLQAVAAFMFLRVICPAIVSPETRGGMFVVVVCCLLFVCCFVDVVQL
jgi:hypothetical protein